MIGNHRHRQIHRHSRTPSRRSRARRPRRDCRPRRQLYKLFLRSLPWRHHPKIPSTQSRPLGPVWRNDYTPRCRPLSRSLIADTEGAESSWRNYARVFLTSLLRQLHRVKHDDVAELYRLISTTPVEDLRDLLGDTPADPTSPKTTAASSAPSAPSPHPSVRARTHRQPKIRRQPFRPFLGPSRAGRSILTLSRGQTKSLLSGASSAPGCDSPSTKP